jgi:hypothetical protein
MIFYQKNLTSPIMGRFCYPDHEIQYFLILVVIRSKECGKLKKMCFHTKLNTMIKKKLVANGSYKNSDLWSIIHFSRYRFKTIFLRHGNEWCTCHKLKIKF